MPWQYLSEQVSSHRLLTCGNNWNSGIVAEILFSISITSQAGDFKKEKQTERNMFWHFLLLPVPPLFSAAKFH